MSLKGFALAVQQTTDVICAYAASPRTLPAVAADPGPLRWVAIGSFRVPRSVRATLEVQGMATAETLLDVAIFGPAKMQASQARIVSREVSLSRSSTFDLEPDTDYILAANCWADVADAEHYGVILTASLGSA